LLALLYNPLHDSCKLVSVRELANVSLTHARTAARDHRDCAA
jgi:hypothetical protein